jgi:hypothetical protein
MQKSDIRPKANISAGFGERLQTAAAAKNAQLEKWRLKAVDANDPAFLEQQAAVLATAAARAERDKQRKAAKDAAKEREMAERKAARDAVEAQSLAAAAAREAAEAEAAAAAVVLAEQRKAARDARYAARKARK